MLNKFELLVPQTLDEALELYGELGSRCKILAGGTDVLAAMHGGHKSYALLMDIKNLEELRGIAYSPDIGLTIGALETHRHLERHPLIQKMYPALFEGVSQVGCVQTRYRGTIGGNICNAAPSGETIGPLMALDASVISQSIHGIRTIPIRDFFPGPKRTVLQEGELLIKIIVPAPVPAGSSAYTKFTRRKSMDLALLGCSVNLTSSDGITCDDVKISLTTAAPTVVRAEQTEMFLKGKVLNVEVMQEAGLIASAEAKPRTSWRATEEYRREVLKEIVPRTIETALQRIRMGV